MGQERSKEVKYIITTETAKGYAGAGGSTNWVHIELTGEDGKTTGWMDLIEDNDASFRPGEIDTFNVEGPDVGLPVVVRLGLRDQEEKDPWAVRYVNVKYNGEEVHFPIHDWIQNEMWFTRGEGLVHHKVCNPAVKAMLVEEVERSKALLPWVPKAGDKDLGRGLPRFVDSPTIQQLPLIFRPTEVWSATFLANSTEETIQRALKMIEGLNIKFDSLESFESLYQLFDKGAPRSPFLDRWKSDEEFGRQQLNSISPTGFQRCNKIPQVCQITNEHVTELLEGKTLEEAMEAGKVYIADYSDVIKNVKRNKNSLGQDLYCPNVICLYFVNSSDDFVPIAIQLVPNDPQTIFTSKDSEHDWMLAKMYFKVAFGNMHEWHYHFLLTHGVMESFAVAVFRGLPRSHPIYKLLRPHLQTVTVINALARLTLIAAGTAANRALALEGEDLARNTYKSFNMDDVVIPEILKKKGLDDKKLLPKYYYRDDALELWDIMESFVRDIIKIYYCHDCDVENDQQLQDFIKDIATEGLGWEDGTTRGIPVPMTTVEQLIRICTSVIYTSSVQHSAVNFPQYEIYKFIPNCPVAMRLPPHKKGEATLQRILDSLPNVEMATIAISIAAALSTYAADEVFIGNYPVKLFVEEAPLKAIEKYKMALDQYDAKKKKRNDSVEHPYIWLLPEKVPNSISI